MLSRNHTPRQGRRSKLSRATIALALLTGSLASGAVTIVDAPASSANPPIPCKQSPDGKSCTQGDDGTGGGAPPWVADDFYLLAQVGQWDYYARVDGAATTHLQGAYLADNLAYTYCSVPNRSTKLLACIKE
ncbi:MAG TPA: hypothetical protein VGN35_01070 [Jatrophihabitantaceae bacterium]|nr:hypothetical protein [Jatrophihabitantaceae bacterium]